MKMVQHTRIRFLVEEKNATAPLDVRWGRWIYANSLSGTYRLDSDHDVFKDDVIIPVRLKKLVTPVYWPLVLLALLNDAELRASIQQWLALEP